MKGCFPSSLSAQAGFFLAALFLVFAFPSLAQAGHVDFPALFMQKGALKSQVSTSSVYFLQLNQDLDFTGETTSTGSQVVKSTATGSKVITQEVTGTGSDVNQDAKANVTASGAAAGAQGIAANTVVGATQTGTGNQVNQAATLGIGTFSRGLQRIRSFAGSTGDISQLVKKGGPTSPKSNQKASGSSVADSNAVGDQEVEAETDLSFTQDADGDQVNQTANVTARTESTGAQEVTSTAQALKKITQVSEGGDQSNQSATGSSTARSSAVANQLVESVNSITIIQE